MKPLTDAPNWANWTEWTVLSPPLECCGHDVLWKSERRHIYCTNCVWDKWTHTYAVWNATRPFAQRCSPHDFTHHMEKYKTIYNFFSIQHYCTCSSITWHTDTGISLCSPTHSAGTPTKLGLQAVSYVVYVIIWSFYIVKQNVVSIHLILIHILIDTNRFWQFSVCFQVSGLIWCVL